MTLKTPRVAMVIANNYEDVEADSPKAHLEQLRTYGSPDHIDEAVVLAQDPRP